MRTRRLVDSGFPGEAAERQPLFGSRAGGGLIALILAGSALAGCATFHPGLSIGFQWPAALGIPVVAPAILAVSPMQSAAGAAEGPAAGAETMTSTATTGTTTGAAADSATGEVTRAEPADPRARSAPEPVVVTTIDLFRGSAVRFQDPDMKACTAASTQSMLNTIAAAGSPNLTWRTDTSFATEEAILRYERAHMTMYSNSPGSDPHGWRNALNYFGWGSIDADVYRDMAYGSFDEAVKAAVIAIATTHKPVGILARGGGHAEYITGFRVSGADPTIGGTDFTVLGVFLSDPLRSNRRTDGWTSYSQLRSGGAWVRFSAYHQGDSPKVDPMDGRIGNSEWSGKWVIVAPVR